LTVLPCKWIGSVTAHTELRDYGSVVEDVQAATVMNFDHDASAQFASPSGTVFEYTIESATVAFTVSGTDTHGCTWSGGTTYVLQKPTPAQYEGFFLDFVSPATYGGQWYISPTRADFDITLACPDGTRVLPQLGPFIRVWFFAKGPMPKLAPDFDFSELKDTAVLGAGTQVPTTYNWDFVARDE
jgi:hypothetical protein